MTATRTAPRVLATGPPPPALTPLPIPTRLDLSAFFDTTAAGLDPATLIPDRDWLEVTAASVLAIHLHLQQVAVFGTAEDFTNLYGEELCEAITAAVEAELLTGAGFLADDGLRERAVAACTAAAHRLIHMAVCWAYQP